jgi:hypothetical protein
MPWTISDVEGHKKGLSDDQKKKWVATANSVLADCIKKGGTDETCAPKAIRIANGVTGNIEYYSICIDKQAPNYSIIKKNHQGKEHIVVPVVMMVEGVHNGSHGPLFHSIAELGKFPASWNGIPVVINHPEIDGMNVSANDPDIIDQQTVGRVYNTYVDGAKLKAEVWVSTEKLQALSAELLDQFEKGELVEVSLGMFTEEDSVTGDWNGETYEAIAKSHRPDHLALLPGGKGACSCADGCGIRVNSDESIKDSPQIDSSINLNLKEEVKMADKTACTPCVKEKVNQLIVNSQGKYTEDDREMLETLSEELLDKVAKPVEKEVIKEVEKTIEINKLTPEDQAALNFGKRQLKERRDGWVKKIQDNTEKGVWAEDELKVMSDATLEKLAKTVKKEEVVDYSLNAGYSNNASSSGGSLYPAGIEVK